MTGRFSAVDKRDCVIREANMRRMVYPKRVAAGKLRQGTADREIAMMDEIAADYKRLAETEMLDRARGEEAQRERDLFK